MKKIFALLLAAVMCLSLVACGSGDNQQETLDTENAIAATPKEVYDAVEENQAKAMQNVYRVTGAVDSISGEYCVIDNLHIYLPTSDLASLSKDAEITIVGQITNVKKESVEMGGGVHTTIIIELENAVLEN